jgi:N6-L-threonylcarbamoyladenine synthase
MLCLGIESTAHTFGAGVVSDERLTYAIERQPQAKPAASQGGIRLSERGRVLSSVTDTYIPPPGWGIKPEEAAGHHRSAGPAVVERALREAGIGAEDLGLVAFSQGPGLPPCLRTGLELARDAALKAGKPLVPVNHCIAHIEIGRLHSGLRDPVTLYVSGGNTQTISFVSGRYRIFGETQDIGIGNALDKLGRELGLGFPAGPKIERLALAGEYFPLPYVVKGMDLSFSGIVTEAASRRRKGRPLEDVCRSFQETCFAMLTEVTERAMAHTGKSECLLTGGVAANRRLQEMLGIMCRERGATFSVVPGPLAGDNGAMIAWTGLLEWRHGKSDASRRTGQSERYVGPQDSASERIDIAPRQRTDEVEISWLSGFANQSD